MTRRPPDIVSVLPTADGGVEVRWQVDTFFPDSAEPEKVVISLNGHEFRDLAGNEDSIDFPAATLVALGTQIVTISVSFWWSGEPAEVQQSSVQVPFQTGGGGGGGATGVVPAARPVITVVKVEPRTLRTVRSSITIAWRSNNYNDGNIFWGPGNAPRIFTLNIRPRGENYQGTFTTDQPLTGSTNYSFTVEVRNTLHSPGWIASTAIVRSAPTFASLRQFLLASGVAIPTGLRIHAGRTLSLRTLLRG